MPGRRDPHGSRGGVPSRLIDTRRVLPPLAVKHDRDKGPLGERLRRAIVRPVESGAASTDKAPHETLAPEELEAAVRSLSEKERLIGLLAAPFAAAIGILVISALIVNDPPALLNNGQVNRLHVSLSLYHDLGGVLLALSVLMLAMAMLRKRLLLGIGMALYGLAVFNLHYWGFGVPFIMGGAWLLVRVYRLQRDLREATGDGWRRPGVERPGGGAITRASLAQPNKRYTPPTSPASRPSSPKPRNGPKAG